MMLILVVGLWMRVYKLGGVPMGFFCDEAERGVDAYSLWQTGTDHYGEPWPIFFRALGEYTMPMQIYGTIPFVAIGGLNETSVRLGSVLWGMVAIVAMYGLGRTLVNGYVGLAAALLMAIQPWSVHYSRTALELVVYLAWYLLGWWIWAQAMKDARWWIGVGLVWGLALYTYNPALITVPLTLGGLLAYGLWKQGLSRFMAVGVGVFLLVAIPMARHVLSGEGLTRWRQVTATEETMAMKMQRTARQYVHQLSPNFFLLGEDTFITRHFARGTGLVPVFLWQVPLMVLGLWEVARRYRILALWLVLYPLAGALAVGGPFTSRSVIGAGLAALLAALGMWWAYTQVLRLGRWAGWTLSAMWGGMAVVSVVLFMNFYVNEYPLKSADFWGWQMGPKEMLGYFQEVEMDYDELLMPGEFNAPEIFLDFYAPTCDKCRIGGIEDFNEQRRQLFGVTSAGMEKLREQGLRLEVQREIHYPDGKLAFAVGEIRRM